MKKKITIAVVLIAAVLAIGGWYFYNTRINVNSTAFLTSKNESKSFTNKSGAPTSNGITFDYGKFDGRWSIFKVTPKKDCTVTIHTDCRLDNGTVYVVALDPDYNIVGKTPADGNKEISFDGAKDKTYLVRIAGKDGSGHFNISIDADKECTIEYHDMFNGKL